MPGRCSRQYKPHTWHAVLGFVAGRGVLGRHGVSWGRRRLLGIVVAWANLCVRSAQEAATPRLRLTQHTALSGALLNL